MKKKNESFRIGLLAAGLAVLFSGHAAAQSCSENKTAGTYLVVCDGYLTPAPGASLVPAKVLATANSDYSGRIKGSGTVSLGGQIVTQVVSGTEKVNADCTGTITYTQTINGQPGPPLSFTFVISENGDRLDGLATDAGSVLSCVLRRTSHNLASDRPAASTQPVLATLRTEAQRK